MVKKIARDEDEDEDNDRFNMMQEQIMSEFSSQLDQFKDFVYTKFR
jgi:hypothetical protein